MPRTPPLPMPARLARPPLTAGLTLLGLLGSAAPALASDQIGVYAKVNKVVVQGTQVVICGAFRVANTMGDYQPLATGYLFYECKGDAAAQAMCQLQWSEIGKAVASKGCVGWSNRHGTYGEDTKNSQVRTTLPAQGPNPYPIDIGVVQMPTSGSEPICASITAPATVHPACDVVAPDLATAAPDLGASADLSTGGGADLSTTPPPSKGGCSAAATGAASGAATATGMLSGLMALGLMARALRRMRPTRG